MVSGDTCSVKYLLGQIPSSPVRSLSVNSVATDAACGVLSRHEPDTNSELFPVDVATTVPLCYGE